ncbi:tetratricopeptide repeat protein [Micromonospora sp. WMMD1082]|uniref:tetratricopeptide repeat protein n=1 Tax=Micromonospora sp. WMMD1082 TaxID=3016104 RepID=UPI002416D100|nr:tetratricopeptide repeat protein [Micromonospora sp. WMMD1082]MDG4795189.1 tetratricopeptide repeat protein [Micromonospora sp. WMMD1082]
MPAAPQDDGPGAARIARAVERAEELVAVGDLPRAAGCLRSVLANMDRAAVSSAAVDAAVLYAHVLTSAGHPEVGLAWARWARPRHGRGPDDPVAVRILGVLAASLHATGQLRAAAAHYRDLTAALTRLDGPDAPRTLAARADLAVVLHASGDCDTAHAELGAVLQEQQSGPDHLMVKLLTRRACMYRDCLDARAAQCFLQAVARARAVGLAEQVRAAAARAPCDRHRRVCTHRRPRPTGQPPAPSQHPESLEARRAGQPTPAARSPWEAP